MNNENEPPACNSRIAMALNKQSSLLRLMAISVLDFETQQRNVLLEIIERMVTEQTKCHQ